MIEENTRKIRVKVTAIVASASLLISGALSQPGKMPDGMYADKIVSPPAVEYTLPDSPDDDGNDDCILPDENKRKKFSFTDWYASRKLYVRLIISIAFAAVCWLMFGTIYFVFGPAVPVLVRYIFKIVSFAVCGLATYASIAKAVAPHVPLGKILSWKTILAVILLACALSFGFEFILSTLQVHI